MENKNDAVQTPREMEQALEHLADRLEEMDKAEGTLGEEMTIEALDTVAGGNMTKPSDTSYATCINCHTRFPYSWSDGRGIPMFCSETCRINYNTRGGTMSMDGSGSSKAGGSQRPASWAELKARSKGGQ